MLDIQVHSQEYLDCFQGLIISYAVWCKRNYETVFAASWGFKYLKEEHEREEKLGNMINSNAEFNRDYLERFHGIVGDYYSGRTPGEILGIIRSALSKGNPCIIYVTNYFFPWNEFYHKNSNGIYHAMMVKGIDEEKQCLYCLDTTYKLDEAILPIDDFLSGCNDECIILSTNQIHESTIPWREILQFSISKLKKGSEAFTDFEEMRMFAEKVRDSLNIKYELENQHGIWVTPLVLVIGGVINGRANFIRMLEFLNNVQEEVMFNSIIEQMQKVVLIWECILGMLIKGHYTGSSKKLVGRIGDKICKAANLEENIANAICDLIGNVKGDYNWVETGVTSGKAPLKDNEIIYVELGNEFNVQSFGISQDTQCTANMNGLGYFLYVNDACKNQIWEAEMMKFFVPQITGKGRDSVACMGQDIKVPKGKYGVLMLLGCGDLGSFSEEMALEFTDGSIQSITVQFSEHNSSRKIFDETVMWMGEWGFVHENGNPPETHLYAQSYLIEQDKELKSLHLPICPNILLFAISLAKSISDSVAIA